MKGIILAGGHGTRLKPLTDVVHKHLLPIGPKPMIHYAIEKLVKFGIRDIIIVINDAEYVRVLGDGRQFHPDVTFCYIYQAEAKGIAHAIYQCANIIGEETFVVHLADNIFMDDIPKDIGTKEPPSILFLKRVSHPENYGVARFEGRKIVDVVEKPKRPPSNYAVTGLYIFDSSFFDIFERRTRPSKRGEYEIADIIRGYIEDYNECHYVHLKKEWYDCGQDLESFVRISKRFSDGGRMSDTRN